MLCFIVNEHSRSGKGAKDVCEIRGIKKGIVSVTTERLVQSGYLIRKNDIHDRRKT